MSGEAPKQCAGAEADLGGIRTASEARAEQTSLRSASPTGLRKVLDGSRPFRQTLGKLRGWRRRHLDGGRQTAQDVALETLLRGVPEAGRERIRAVL